MPQNIQELQRAAVMRMFSVGDAGEQACEEACAPKVLVTDRHCCEMLSQLLTKGGLRKHFVTLSLSLAGNRGRMPAVPVVYFVEPSVENISMIVKDLEQGLYAACFVNFASSVPRPLLEDLARGAVNAGKGGKVAGVFDRYASFVALAPALFSLNLPAAYKKLHSPCADSTVERFVIERLVERIVEGLISVLVTLRSIPVIRCPPGPVAQMVARRLDARLRELLARGSTDAAELFSRAAISGSEDRMVLCILDRDMDLATMLQHTWIYQAMVHDVLGMSLNRVTVQDATYDIDDKDRFWAAHASEPLFPDVADAVQAALEELKTDHARMGQSQDLKDLKADISALPEVAEKKRMIEKHANIASALEREVTARGIDQYYLMEHRFSTQSVGASVSEFQRLLDDESQRGTVLDKTRALMMLYLAHPSIPVQRLADVLQAKGGDISAICYLGHLMGMKKLAESPPGSDSGALPIALSVSGTLGGFADRVLVRGQGLLAEGISNIRNIMSARRELAICQEINRLVEERATPAADDGYLYLDPLTLAAAAGGPRAPFRRAVAFVVGGGNYAEMQAVQEWAHAAGRDVIYGSTHIPSPADFVEELSHLARAHNLSRAKLHEDAGL
jgi:hypothetical protein